MADGRWPSVAGPRQVATVPCRIRLRGFVGRIGAGSKSNSRSPSAGGQQDVPVTGQQRRPAGGRIITHGDEGLEVPSLSPMDMRPGLSAHMRALYG